MGDVLIPAGFVGSVSEAQAASRCIVKDFLDGSPLPATVHDGLVSSASTGRLIAMSVSFLPPGEKLIHLDPFYREAIAIILKKPGRQELFRKLDAALDQLPWGRLCRSTDSGGGIMINRKRAVAYLRMALEHWDELHGYGDIFAGSTYGEARFVAASTSLRAALHTLGVTAQEQTKADFDLEWLRDRAAECVRQAP